MRLVMMGTGLFAEPTFEALLQSPHQVVGLVTQPDRTIGAERGSTRQTGRGMKTIALERGLPVLQPEKINTPEGVAALTELKPDLLVVAAYGQILSREVLGVPPLGGINVHASLLPKYRGAAPVAWAIYHGEKTTGVTIIKMTTGLDAGDMLMQAETDIRRDETAGDLEARLAPLGARLATDAINQIAAGTARGTKQDQTQVTKAPKLKKEDGLLDWTRYSARVCDQIRVMQPWPTPYSYFHSAGKSPLRVIMNKAIWFDYDDEINGAKGMPGTVVVSPFKLSVIAGDNTKVEIVELQPAGKRRMSAAEFLRGHPLREGDRFGPEQP